MDFIGWLRLLARNRFAVHPKFWYIAAIVSVMSFLHMVLRWMQRSRFGERIAATPIPLRPARRKKSSTKTFYYRRTGSSSFGQRC